MKNRFLVVYVVLGFIATVALLPKTRWVVLNQIDVLAGKWRNHAGYSDYGNQPWVRPSLPDLEDSRLTDETAQFLRSISPSNDSATSTETEERFRRLYLICQRRNEPRYWAQFIRAASFRGQMPSPMPRENAFQLPNQTTIQNLLEQGCKAAIALEPDNAFFQLILSGVQFRLGELALSKQTFAQVMHSERFDDYVLFEPELRNQYILSHFGYRGDQLHLWILADELFPDLGTIQSVCKWHGMQSGLAGQLSCLKVGLLMMNQGPTAIHMIIGRNILNFGLDPTRHGAMYKVFTDAELDRAVESIRNRTKDATFLSNAIARYRVVNSKIQHYGDDFKPNEIFVNIRPAISASSLLSLLLLPFAVGLAWLKSRSTHFSAASPYLIWFLASVAEPIFGDWSSSATGLVLATGLFVPALFPRTRKFTDYLGCASIVIGFALSLGAFPAAIPSLLFALSLFCERKINVQRPIWAISGILIACVLCSIIWITITCKLGMASGIFWGSLTFLGTALGIPFSREISLPKITAVTAGVLGGIFGLVVFWDLIQDREMTAQCRQFLSSSDLLR